MKRGASPVITSTLLVLVSVAIASIFYGWATASTTNVAGAIYSDAERARKEILSDVEIMTPPPAKDYDTNQPVIIHNSGSTSLTKVSITYLTPDGSDPKLPGGIKIGTDSTISSIGNTDWPIQQLNPGDAIIIWLPPDNYSGYTILITSYSYSTSKTIGVP